MENNWEKMILCRYLGEFQPADAKTCTIRKSSEDIQCDLSEMVHIPLSNISEEMIRRGYEIEIDEDAQLHWLMKRVSPKMIEE